MKQFVIPVLLSSILWFSCTGSDTSKQPATALPDSTQFTNIQWQDSVVNFGSVNMGEQTKVVFRFKNTGTKPLVLAEVRAGCGCTVADYTKGAIAPGVQGEVTAAFDSNKSHPGEVRKSIFVTANTFENTKHTLIFTGLIKELAK